MNRKQKLIGIVIGVTLVIALIVGIVYYRHDQSERYPEWSSITLEDQELQFPFPARVFDDDRFTESNSNFEYWKKYYDEEMEPSGPFTSTGSTTIFYSSGCKINAGIKNLSEETKTKIDCDVTYFDYLIYKDIDETFATGKVPELVVADKIEIGDSAEDLVEAFGEPDDTEIELGSSEHGHIYYKTKYHSLGFYLEDNIICGIIYDYLQ